jgi:hypothetical protein
MDEKKFLENFAKILGPGAQEELDKIEQKRLKEQKLLKSFSAALSKTADFEVKLEEENPKPKEVKLPDAFIKKVPTPQIVIETPIVDVVSFIEPTANTVSIEEKEIVEIANTDLGDFVSQAASFTSKYEKNKKKPTEAETTQKEIDKLNNTLRKEIDLIKKSISDFHRLLHLQSMKIAWGGGSSGGGEVILRGLDDVDYQSLKNASEGQVLTYDSTLKKWVASNPTGGGGGGNGYTGSIGPIGYSGSQGTTGVGYTGSSGVGYTGSKGSIGTDGYTGSIGYTGSAADNSRVINYNYVGNGSSNTFTIEGGYIPESIVVFVNGVKQIAGLDVYIDSGNTVNFVESPANNYLIDVFGFQANNIVGNGPSGPIGYTGSAGTVSPTDRLISGDYEVVLAPSGQLNLPSANNTENKNARVQSAANIDILAENSKWTFDTNGVLTLPDHGKIIFNTANPEQYIEGTMGFQIHASDVVSISVVANTWSFGNDGNITLPAGGDILDSGGNSVLSTDWLHVPSDIIPNENLTYNLGNTTFSWSNVYVESVNIPTGSIVSGANAIQVIVAPLLLDSVVDSSTGVGDDLNIGDYGLLNGISHPWTVYRFTTDPSPILEVNDIISGAGVPAFSGIEWVGTGANAAIAIANTSIGDISPTAWPQPAQYMYVVREIVNAGLAITTGPNTDITLNPGPSGFIVPHADIVPFTNQGIYLGSPTKRFKGAYFGANTIYVLDEVKGTDIGIGARNNLLYITGSAGIQVGEFTLQDNQISIANSSRDVLFGTTPATGNVVFNRPIVVKSYDTGNTTFAVTREGKVSILTPSIPAGDIGAMSIIGSANGYYQGVTNPGGMLHITGNDNVATRVTIDSFGVNGIPAIVGRDARGTAESPTNTLANDVLIRVSGIGWTGGNNFTIPGVTVAPTALEAQATENYSNTTIGSKWNFYNAPTGNITRTLTASIDTTGLTTNTANVNYIVFQSNTSQKQTVAFNKNTAVTSITTGLGLTQTATVGDIGIDSYAVLDIKGTNNQIYVANVGQVYTLSLPQNLSQNSSPTFNTITANNLVLTGNTVVSNNIAIDSKILYLAYNSTGEYQIDGGGIYLGNSTQSYAVSFLYDLNNRRWDTNGAGLKTLDIVASNSSITNLRVSNTAHIGAAYEGDDYPNAIIQVDENVNSYAQIHHQNQSDGTQASTDFVAANDLADDSSYYIDMGINSSNYSNTQWTISGPNDSYLYNANGNLTVGTATNNTNLLIHIGGTLAENQVAKFNSSGLTVNGDITSVNYYGTLKGTANNTLFVGSTSAANVVSNAQLQGNLALYTSNAYINSILPNYVSNAQLIANLANYQTTAGLSANVAKLTSNNSTYAYGKTEISLNVNTALVSNNTLFVGSTSAANVVSNAQLTSNLAKYALLSGATFTGNVVTNAYLTSNIFTVSSTATFNGNTTFNANVVTNANLVVNTATFTANVFIKSFGNTGITFNDSTFQNTAYIPPSFISTAFNGENVSYTSTTTAYVVPLGSVINGTRNITLGSNNTFVIGKSGKFILNYSIQYKNDGADNADVYVWMNKNNSPVEDTSTVFSIPHKKSNNDPGKLVAVTPLFFTANTGDTIQIMAASPDDTTVTMVTIPAGTTPIIPRTPAVITTINEID